MRPFRFIYDPLFVACAALYALNRFVLKPHFATPFLHEHLNDLICIPFWVPIMLLLQRTVGLRAAGDEPPRAGEILIPLIVWSWLFELWLPYTEWGRTWCTADPWDVFCYSVGALGAAMFWWWWYGEVRIVEQSQPTAPSS